MLSLKIVFTFMIYAILQIKCINSKVNVVLPSVKFGEKCKGMFCTCEEARKIGGENCKVLFLNEEEFLMITFNFNIMPAKFLQGHNLTNIEVIKSEIDVDENAFEGMIALNRFAVTSSHIKKVPSFRSVKDSIMNITIHSSLLTSLDGENLQNLTALKYVSFRYNFIRFIDPLFFQGTENLFYLDLSHNKLTSIPPNLLDSMKSLLYFGASHNNLLHVNNLFAITHPRHIFLMFNNITDAYPIFQLNMKKVNETFHGLTGIDVDDTKCHLIRCEKMTDYPTYTKIIHEMGILDLSYNLIQETSQPFFPCYRTGNHKYGYSFRTKSIVLRGNKIRNLNNLLRYSIVQELNVAYSQLQHLTNNDFILVAMLKLLLLPGNEIRWMDKNTFEPLITHLQHLDLSFNLIESLNGSIRYLAHLDTLILANNLIRSIAKEEFIGLNELRRLIVKDNQLKTLGNLQPLLNLFQINVVGNDIQSVRPDDLPTSLLYMHFSDNPFKCDCYLEPFIHQIKENNTFEVDTYLCLRTNLENRLQNSSNCPEMCSCRCIDYEDVSFIFVDCSFKNLTVVPPFLRNESTLIKSNETVYFDYQDSFTMEQNMYPSLYIKDRVLGISLENNNLESLDAVQLPPNLTLLYLSNNMLKWLPESIFDLQINLKEVSLSGNPWICDCSTLKFKKWLTAKHDSIRDINNTRCGRSDVGGTHLNGRLIWTLTDLDLCPTNIALIISLPVGILFSVTLCLVTMLLYSVYNLNIKVFLYSHGFTFVKEEDLDHDKTFDVFISFSHKDGEFVTKEIIREIEKRDPNICMCIHYRDFVPGEFIYDNIIRAVHSSKRTLLILSSDFLVSEWCLLEFRTAHIQVLEDKVNRIIVIKMGDLPNEIDPAIKAYLDSTTYLTWGEKNFWNKLLYVLPSGCSAKNSVPRNLRDNGDVLNCSFTDV